MIYLHLQILKIKFPEHIHFLSSIKRYYVCCWLCKYCRKEYNNNSFSYYCSLCDYDICEECYNKNKTTLKANITKEDDFCGKKERIEREKAEEKEKSKQLEREKQKEENVEKSIDNKITENVKFYKYQETDLSKFKIKEHIYNFILFESVNKTLFFINVSSDYISVYDFLTYEKTFQIKYPFLDEIKIMHFFDTINRRDLIIAYTKFKR